MKNLFKKIKQIWMGNKSVEVRFKDKSQAEISELMRKVRYTAEDKKKSDKMAAEFVRGLNDAAE